jgi:hypothetical protein
VLLKPLGGNRERLDLSGRIDRRHNVYFVVLRAPVMLARAEAVRRVEASELTAAVAIESATSILQWGAIIAGALVAAALSLVLIAFGLSSTCTKCATTRSRTAGVSTLLSSKTSAATTWFFSVSVWLRKNILACV